MSFLRNAVCLAVVIWQLVTIATAQSSMDSQDGFDVGKNAGITVAVYTICIAGIVVTIQVIKKTIVDRPRVVRRATIQN
jgi:hypothetical protein